MQSMTIVKARSDDCSSLWSRSDGGGLKPNLIQNQLHANHHPMAALNLGDDLMVERAPDGDQDSKRAISD